jgi:hypothetical protein
MKRILFLFFLAIFINSARSQIVINEVNCSNVSGQTDGFGKYSDYVEIYNATPGFSLSLDNYYLTNDITNLYKWKFPNGLSLGPASSASAWMVVWCTGRNLKEPGPTGRWHTNFDIEQCKNQWLILSYLGVIKDSLFVKRTKPDDTRGRYPDYSTPSNQGWKVLQGAGANLTTFEASNTSTNIPSSSVFLNYAPIPTFSTPAGFTPPTTGNYTMWIPDTVNFQINYTLGNCSQLGGSIPCPSYTGCLGSSTSAQTYTYVNDLVSPISASGITQVITAVTYPKPNGVGSASLATLYLPSFEETNIYFNGADLSVNPGFGVLSVVTNTTFFTTASAQTLHVEYFDMNTFYSEAGGSISKPPNDGWLNQQRGFDVGFDDRTGQGCRLTGNIYNNTTFGVSTRSVFPTFEIRAAGKDNFSAKTPTVATPAPLRTTHMRDAFAQTFAIKNNLAVEGMHYKPVRTFINGCYWGIYEFRELPDQDYLNYYFGLDRDSVDILRQHVTGSVITPNLDTGWVTTPLSGPAPSLAGTFNHVAFNYLGGYNNPNYNNLKKRLSINSFTDFFIYNSFFVNPEPPALNMSWWRRTNIGGPNQDTLMRWRYFLWDMNNILDLEVAPVSVNTAALTNATPPCIYTSTLYPAASFTASSYTTTPSSSYAGHGYMLYKLMSGAFANIEFRHGYITRYMDLLNTTLRCDKLTQHFNYFRTIFTPEIPFHSAFWSTNQPEWEDAMDTLKIRLLERCGKVDSLLQKCMNLDGPYQIHLNVKPAGAGTIDFNTLHINNFIWSGDYYQNKVSPYILSYIEAWPTDTSLYVFDHWEWTSTTNSTTASPGTLNSGNYLSKDSLSFIISSGDSITAVFVGKGIGIKELSVKSYDISLHPNPNNGSFILKINGEIKNGELLITNSFGQKVHHQKVNPGTNTINTTNLVQGFYHYILTENKLRVNTGKLLIQ